MAGKSRKAASEDDSRPVKLSVEVDVLTHSKLAALAALRRCSQSSIAAEAIRSAVNSVVVFDRSVKSAGRVNPTDEVIGGGEAA